MTGTKQSSAGAAKSADVLLAFARSEVLGVSEIGRLTAQPKSVVHRILQALVARDLVVPVTTGRGYRLGPAMAALGTIATLRQLDLRARARPVLERLRDETSETATVSQRVGHYRIFADQAVNNREIHMTVSLGKAYPLTVGATGKAILAFLPPSVLDGVIEGVASDGGAADLMAEVARVRERGFATSAGQRNPEAAAVAAPVFDSGGGVIGAVSLCGPGIRLDDTDLDRMAPNVRAAARDLSRSLARVSP